MPSFFFSAPANTPLTVCGLQPVASTIWAIVAPSLRRSMAISIACLVPSRVFGAGVTSAPDAGSPAEFVTSSMAWGTAFERSGFGEKAEFIARVTVGPTASSSPGDVGRGKNAGLTQQYTMIREETNRSS